MAADPTTPAPAPDVVPEPTTDPGPETAPDETATLPYVTKLWHELPLYLCPACGYDTLLHARIEAHLLTCRAYIESQHAPEEPAPDDEAPATEAPPPREEV